MSSSSPKPNHNQQQQQPYHHQYPLKLLLPPIHKQFPSPYPTNHPYHHHHLLPNNHRHYYYPYPQKHHYTDHHPNHIHSIDLNTIPPLLLPHSPPPPPYYCTNSTNSLPNHVPIYYSSQHHPPFKPNPPPHHIPHNISAGHAHPPPHPNSSPYDFLLNHNSHLTPSSPSYQHVPLFHQDSGLDHQDSLVDNPRWTGSSSATSYQDKDSTQPVNLLIVNSNPTPKINLLPKSPFSPDASNDSTTRDTGSANPVLGPPPVPLSLNPIEGKCSTDSAVDMSCLVMTEDGVDIGKKRDYMVFTRDMYAQMIDSLKHPNDPLPAHITDRRRWRRLMKLLTLHQDQPKHQCITWHHSPLWIVAIEDWNKLIWAFHKVTVSKMDLPSDLVPGHLGCYSVAKTARLLSREYQTRRSRCGIFIEYIHQVLLTCPMCGTNAARSSPTTPDTTTTAVAERQLLHHHQHQVQNVNQYPKSHAVPNLHKTFPPATGHSVQKSLDMHIIDSTYSSNSYPPPSCSAGHCVQKLLAIENGSIDMARQDGR